MKSRLFKAACLVSVALAGCTLVLWMATFFVTPWDHRLSLSHGFHLGVWSGSTGETLGRLVIFNNAEYGPYSGSTIQIGDGNGNVYPRFTRRTGWGDAWGVYYRYFRWPDGHTLWTLMVSLWYPLLAFSLLPVVWVVQHRRPRGLHVIR